MRIIAGTWRGRTLESPAEGTVRPTSDKVRGALFNIIQHSAYPITEDTRALDGFCGSGALGLEALSRGASFGVFIDNDIAALQLAKKNAENFKAAKQCAFEMRDLSKPQTWRAEPFDLVFLDPPYRKALPGLALGILTEGGFIAQNALAVVETAKGEDFPLPKSWESIDTRSWGETSAHFLIYK
jgi:16S rRNA (guanine966-N2)-methyltransferase